MFQNPDELESDSDAQEDYEYEGSRASEYTHSKCCLVVFIELYLCYSKTCLRGTL